MPKKKPLTPKKAKPKKRKIATAGGGSDLSKRKRYS